MNPKILFPLLGAALLSSATLSSAYVHRNLTASESTIDNASPRYLKGTKKKKNKHMKHTTATTDNSDETKGGPSLFKQQ